MPSTANKSDSSDTDERQPKWNTSVNTFVSFLLKLRKWIAKKNNNYRTVVEYGYVVSRNFTCFMNDNHLDRYKAGLITKGTFAEPCKIVRTTVDDTGLAPFADAAARAAATRCAARW